MINSDSIPGPAYRIITTRLVIRCLEPMDVPLIHTAVNQSLEHLLPWMLWAKQEPVSLQERIEYLRIVRGKFDLGMDYAYGIFNRSGTILVGAAGLHTRLGQGVREIGYWIHKEYLNQGYATETSAALTRAAFEIDHVTRVEIHCDPRNIRSAAVPRKLGYIHEATLHHRVEDVNGNLRDSMIWSLFENNYPTSIAASADIQAFDAIGRRII
jgi:RimJ/RimL family protein N-acetyltransferase